MFYCGYVTILGETNAGKSTLINALIGEKIAIVSPKTQTTRENTLGIYNDYNSQIIFIDTPGFHKKKNKIDDYMFENIDRASKDTDIILYVLSAKKPLIQQYEELEKYNKKNNAIKIVAISKIDETTFEKMYPEIERFSKVCTAKEILPISALKKKNLDVLIDMLKKNLPSYDNEFRYYEVEDFTDKSVRFLSAELIREKILLLLDDEVPHGVAVQIDEFDESDKPIHILVTIFCERESHKAILLGKNGDMIKKISTESRRAIEKMLGESVYLEVFVKVKKGWLDSKSSIEEMGYKFEE